MPVLAVAGRPRSPPFLGEKVRASLSRHPPAPRDYRHAMANAGQSYGHQASCGAWSSPTGAVARRDRSCLRRGAGCVRLAKPIFACDRGADNQGPGRQYKLEFDWMT